MKYTKYKQIRSGGFFKVYSTLSMDNLRLMIQYLWKYSFVNKKETNTLLYREIERYDLPNNKDTICSMQVIKFGLSHWPIQGRIPFFISFLESNLVYKLCTQSRICMIKRTIYNLKFVHNDLRDRSIFIFLYS